MINVVILSVLNLSNRVRRVTFQYEDSVFPGKPRTSKVDINAYGLVTYYDMGVSYTMGDDESAPILAALAAKGG